jgi:hypothetical protein
MTTWTRYMSARGAALRLVPEAFQSPDAVTAWAIDLGGLCYTDRTRGQP